MPCVACSGGWVATGRPWAYDRDRYDRVARARQDEQQAMRRYIAGGECRMELLRRELDDPFAEPCGRCDVCAGPWYPTGVSSSAVDAARTAIDRPGVDVEARTQWPTGMPTLGVDVKGRIAEDERALDGRAVARLSDIGWGTRLRDLLAAPDAPVTTAVLNAVIAVLRTWGWTERPVAVVAMPSRQRPQLVGSLAARIAELGRLEPSARWPSPMVGRPVATAATAPTASPRCGIASWCRPSSNTRWRGCGVRCCWSTTSPTRAGP